VHKHVYYIHGLKSHIESSPLSSYEKEKALNGVPSGLEILRTTGAESDFFNADKVRLADSSSVKIRMQNQRSSRVGERLYKRWREDLLKNS
jgi:hypothetical protein